MRFESHWLGDAVAVPSCGTDDREDASFESLGARSWVGVDGRSNHVDPDPIAVARQDWRDTAINLALAGSGQSAQLSLQRAGVDTKTAPTDFAGWRAWVTSVRFDRRRTVVDNASRTRDPPRRSGLGDDRRPNAEGHRNYPLRDRVWKKCTTLELIVA
jgi:hypothetical protein